MTALETIVARLHADPRTWSAVARAAGLSPIHLQRIAAGERKPTLETAERIANALGGKLFFEVVKGDD